MTLTAPETFTFDKGRVLPEEERRRLEDTYVWPRPERKLCRRETNNDSYRLGRR